MRYIFLFLTAFLVFLSPKISMAQADLRDKDKWLPYDYDPRVQVLLIDVDNMSSKQVKKMVKWLDKKFPYKYRLLHDEWGPKSMYDFPDTEKFRFVLSCYSYELVSSHDYTKMFVFHFYDRLKDYSHGEVRGRRWPHGIVAQILVEIQKNLKE